MSAQGPRLRGQAVVLPRQESSLGPALQPLQRAVREVGLVAEPSRFLKLRLEDPSFPLPQ